MCVCVPVWDLGPGAWGVRKERGESGNAVVVVVAVVVVGGGKVGE